MSNEKQTPAPPPSGGGRRRGSRFPVLVPIHVKWTEPNRTAHATDAQAQEVNVYGGLVQFPDKELLPPVGTEMDLTNLFSGEEIRARAAAIRRSRNGALLGVAVELLLPSETFWGLTFRLKKTTWELLKLDQAITGGNIDSRVLREFRDAVDYVRKTAWAVQEWQERQLQHRDTATVLPLLFAERVRRATQLCATVAAGMEDHDVTSETVGIEGLFRAVRQLHQDLQGLFKNSPPQ